MIKDPIQLRLHELLKPRGFSRRNGTWNRRANSIVEVISVQVGKSLDIVTINVGVLHPEVYRKSLGTEVPRFISEPSCTVRARLGELIDGKHRWWSRYDVGVTEELDELVRGFALPFLDRMHSAEAMAKFLISQGVTKARTPYPLAILHLAILMDEQGDRAGACALLNTYGAKINEGWSARFKSVAERLGCC